MTTRLLTIPLFEWLAVLFRLPFIHFVTGLLNRLLSWTFAHLQRRIWRTSDPQDHPPVLPIPVRVCWSHCSLVGCCRSWNCPCSQDRSGARSFCCLRSQPPSGCCCCSLRCVCPVRGKKQVTVQACRQLPGQCNRICALLGNIEVQHRDFHFVLAKGIQKSDDRSARCVTPDSIISRFG